MGNAASSEEPRKGPQKLSKPNPFHRPTAADLVSPSDLSASSSTRYTNDYLAASRPALSVDDFGPLAHKPLADYDDGASRSTAEAWPPSRRDSRRLAPGDVPALPAPMTDGGHHSFGFHDLQSGIRPSRANSMIVASRAQVQVVTRAQSMHSSRHQERTSISPHFIPPESGRLVPPAQGSMATPSAVAQVASTSLSSGNHLSRPPPADDHQSGLMSRDDLDGSLYIPMRRRSLIQTPGVATRIEFDQVRTSTKPKLENQVKAEHRPKAEHRDSIMVAQMDSPTLPPEILSLPAYRHSEPHQRAVTPCETDYQQLGGMKFGTLHITNGSPVPSPAVQAGKGGAVRQQQLGATARGARVQVSQLSSSRGSDEPQANSQSPFNHPSAKPEPAGANPRRISASTALNSHPTAATPAAGRVSSTSRPNDGCGHSKAHLRDGSGQDLHPASPRNAAMDCDYLSPEVFHVRNAPNAKSHDKGNLSGPGKAEPTSVSRSDSGFVSASTTSSSGSRAALSNADSGYSSSFSLKSLRSNSREKNRNSQQNGFINPFSPRNGQGPQAAEGVADRPSATSPRGFMTLMSRDKGRRKSVKVEKGQAASHVSAHAHTRSVDAEAPESKHYLLQRLISSSKRRSTTTAGASHDTLDVNIGENTCTNKTLYSTAHKPATLIVGSSRETLQTIVASDRVAAPKHIASASQSARQFTGDQLQRRRESLVLGYGLGEEDALRRSTRRSRGSAGAKDTEARGRGEDTHGYFRSGRTHHERHRSHRGSRQAAYPASGDSDGNVFSSEAPRAMAKPASQSRQASQTRPLKPRMSLPDLATRPLPPLPTPSPPTRNLRPSTAAALRYRSLRTPRSQSSQPWLTSSESAAAAPPRANQENLRASQRHVLQEQPASTGLQNHARPSHVEPNCQPPVVYRQQHFRDRSGGSAPRDEQGRPYRILHSYNSPAYRNSPIWG